MDKTVAFELPGKVKETGDLRPVITVIEGNDKGKNFILSEREEFIGRDASLSICLHDKSVSRRHLSVRPRDKTLFVKDLGSSNGTYYHNKVIKEESLSSGEMIQIGQTVLIFSHKSTAELKSFEDLYKRATTDPLTGVFNRGWFLQMAYKLMMDPSVSGDDHALAMIDIDFFKKVNDTWGHQNGDEVLKHTARLLKKSLRGQDLIGRYGGEEFIVLVKHIPNGTVFERMRKVINKTPCKIQTQDGLEKEISVSVSIGVAVFQSERNIDFNKIISIADNFLYSAKNQGRNRVVTGR